VEKALFPRLKQWMASSKFVFPLPFKPVTRLISGEKLISSLE
jgi:hypothetical protein